METSTQTVRLNYGNQNSWVYSIEQADWDVQFSPALPSVENPELAIREAMEAPLEYPPLSQAVVQGDQIVIAFDPQTPRLSTIIKTIWNTFANQGVAPSDITLLQKSVRHPIDPRGLLPDEVASQVNWIVHDEKDEDQSGYLATTANGQRVYLAKALLEADYILTIGTINFDARLGYSGTHSVLFPGLSTSESQSLFQGDGHSELTPDDARPLREMVDEIGWLLGVQFAVQVVPAAQGEIAEIQAGLNDAVLRKGIQSLQQSRKIELAERVDLVVASIEVNNLENPWTEFSEAIQNLKSLVTNEGQLIILSNLQLSPSESLQLLMEEHFPQDALAELKRQGAEDAFIASRLADASSWCRVYLMSQLEEEIVEDFFMISIHSQQELKRILDSNGSQSDIKAPLFIDNANTFHGRVLS